MMSGGNFYTLGKEQQESLAPEIHEVQSELPKTIFMAFRAIFVLAQQFFIEGDDFHYSPGLPPAHLDVSEMKFL
jgi:hypothetical protein